MIKSIRIRGFKSFRDVTLKLGGLNLLVGTNASGKSNFFDALRVLQGIGYGLTVDEIFNGKPRGAINDVWEPIRGGMGKAGFIDRSVSEPNMSAQSVIGFDVEMQFDVEKQGSVTITYSIEIDCEHGVILQERLADAKGSILERPGDDVDDFSETIRGGTKGGEFEEFLFTGTSYDRVRSYLPDPVLFSLLSKDSLQLLGRCLQLLRNVQHLDPSPQLLREYSQSRSVTRMGERGENFAALVSSILADEKASAAYVSWLQELTPSEVESVKILRGADQEPLFALSEGGIDYSARVLSDGTLRFAALAAALFQSDMPALLLLEEVENGIHPTRLQLLMQLLRTQVVVGTQIIATTHSPHVLSWLDPEEYATTFLFRRNEETGESTVTPLSELPHLHEVIRHAPIGDLFADGWMEGID